MNLIYLCVFLNKDQLDLLKLFLFSMLLYSNLDSYDFVVITTLDFLEDINKVSKLFNINIKTMVTTCKTVEDSMMNRYKIFEYSEIQKYSKILYLDIDILIQKNIDVLFNLEIEDKIYAVPQPNSKLELPFFGSQLFDFTKVDKNIQGMNGGVLLFKNTDTMSSLFTQILNHRNELASKNINIIIMDQCLLNYHCVTNNLFGSTILKNYINLSHPLENPKSPIDNNEIIMNHFYDRGKLSKIQRLKYHLTHLLEIIKDTDVNNDFIKNIKFRQYKWNGGNIIFDNDGILRTSWGAGRYKLINNKVGIASWSGINHTIIFNNLYNNFVSINNNNFEYNNHPENTILKECLPSLPKLNRSLVYFCVFHQKGYADLLKYLLISLKMFSNYELIDLLVFTSENLVDYINSIGNELFLKIQIKTFDFKTMHEAGCARLHIFEYENINEYSNILYLDTDIIIQGDLNKLFDCLKEDKLYAKKEYDINGTGHGALFFDFTKWNPTDKSLNSGVLLFKNSSNMRTLFNTVNTHIATLKEKDSLLPECMDQSFIAYNFIRTSMCNLEDISEYIYLAEKSLPDSSNIIIVHFTAPIGNYMHKMERMKNYLNKISTKLTELCILGEKYYVDKSPVFGSHTYTPQYHKLFSDMKNNVKLLLEIGIGNIPLMKALTCNEYKPGASLRMWQDYFSKSNIVGCDILENVLFNENRITTFQVDQNNIESLNKLINQVKKIEEYADIIIDDGSHIQEHMVTSFKELWKLVKPDGGIYIIEDIHISFIDKIINLNKECEFTDAECIYIHRGNFVMDNFVAFRKNSKIITFENRNDMIKNYCNIISFPKILEIGIFKGEFFDYIVSNCNIESIDGVDLFIGYSSSGDVDGNNPIVYNIEKSYSDLLEKYKGKSNINLYKSDSSTFLENKEDNTYDIIYIDGDHSYEGFKKDLLVSFRKIKNGGYIMGHDYEMNILKAQNIYEFGVKKAVDEFCSIYNQKILAKANDGCVSFCIKINKNL